MSKQDIRGIRLKKPALLILDMQKDLVYHEKRRVKYTAIIPDMKEIIYNASVANIPIFYSKFVLEPHDIQFERFDEVYCVRGTEGCEIIDELKPLSGHVVEKQKNSAFFGTDLDKMLQEKDVDTVIIMGIQTQICIMTTAADASFRDYKVIVVKDCVTSTREEKKEWALKWIKEYVGDVLSSEETLELLKRY